MSGTDPLTGARYPTSGDAAAIAQYIQNAVNDLSDNAVPYFTSSSARDSAFSAWVAQGNTMRDGLHAYVASTGLQEYVGGTWHPSWQAFNPAVTSRLQNFSSPPIVASPGSGTWGYRLEGNRVWCRGWGTSSAGASAGNNLATAVPSIYRPVNASTVIAHGDNGTATAQAMRLEIDSDGILYTKYAIPAGSFICFDQCSWPIG